MGKFRRKPGIVFGAAWCDSLLCHKPLISSDIDVVQFHVELCLFLDGFGHIPPRIDRMTLQFSEDRSYGTFFRIISFLKSIDHLVV